VFPVNEGELAKIDQTIATATVMYDEPGRSVVTCLALRIIDIQRHFGSTMAEMMRLRRANEALIRQLEELQGHTDDLQWRMDGLEK